MTVHLIAYTAAGGESGVAEVPSDRSRPSWADCFDAIPGFVTGRYLGLAPTYTLTYSYAGVTHTRTLTRSGVERIGRTAVRHASDIAVLDETGADVTFDFVCFANA